MIQLVKAASGSMREPGWDRVIYEPMTGPEAPWYQARREAMDHVLAAAASWHHHLVLRGSATLRAWFGASAREPNDLDFVVLPPRWRWNDVPADHMYEDIVARASQLAAEAGGLRIEPRPGYAENIYRFPYRGIPGRRITVTWQCPRRGEGSLNLDFAFGELVPTPTIRTEIPRLAISGPPIVLPTADPPLSLAWKLLWLEAETNDESLARGKDLFDAVLLAEHCALTPPLLRDIVFADYQDYRRALPNYLARLEHMARCVEWSDFAEDYPLLESAHDEFTTRLLEALTPTLSPQGHPLNP